MFGPAVAGRDSAPAPGADARTIGHVLDRLGFGARPGDVERVRAIGVTAYIDQQLHPERIDDGNVTARLAAFETLSMSTRDLAERYFLPAIQLRRQAQKNAEQAQPAAGAPGGDDSQNTPMTAGPSETAAAAPAPGGFAGAP